METTREANPQLDPPHAGEAPLREDGSVAIWNRGPETASFPTLEGDEVADVVVVGAGLVGLLSAYFCQRAGLRVIVLEAHLVGSGETSRTTGHVTAQLDVRWKKVVADLGAQQAGALGAAALRGIEDLEGLVHALGIDCGWRRVSAWRFTENEGGLVALREEALAAAEAGIPYGATDTTAPLPWPTRGALRCDHQAEIDPLPFLAALARAVDGGGSRVYERTRALEVRDGDEPSVTTATGVVRARHVIVATHAPFNNRLLLQTKIAHYRSYVLALRCRPSIPDGLFWDDDDPYHYLRAIDHGGRRLVLVGGADHRTGQEDGTESLAALEAWARERLPGSDLERSWSGQILVPVDGLPYVGRNSFERNVYEATGFAGNGWAYGALAARLLADLVQGIEHPLTATLAATRITPKASAAAFVRENASFPWHYFGDRLSTEATEVQALPRGSGRLFMARAGKKIAVYRDAEGELHALSPICPHMGCIVHFNSTEVSWDCPCHGSRFDVRGGLLSGPASTGLQRLELSAEPVS